MGEHNTSDGSLAGNIVSGFAIILNCIMAISGEKISMFIAMMVGATAVVNNLSSAFIKLKTYYDNKKNKPNGSA